MNPVYILCTPEVYEAALAAGSYQPESLQTEGFIHASPAHQLTRVANLYYSEHAVLRMLTIDPKKARPELKWETISNGDVYPHFYGPLNMDAVVATESITRNADGRFEIQVQ